jgi:hypothetical protein
MTLTLGFGLIVLLAVVAGVLAVLTILGSPRGLIFTAFGVLLLAIVEIIARSGLH